mgnify:CR=1 FL=1
MESWLRVGILFAGYLFYRVFHPTTGQSNNNAGYAGYAYICRIYAGYVDICIYMQDMWRIIPKHGILTPSWNLVCRLPLLNPTLGTFVRCVAQIFLWNVPEPSVKWWNYIWLESLNVCQRQGIHQYNPRIPKPSEQCFEPPSLHLCNALSITTMFQRILFVGSNTIHTDCTYSIQFIKANRRRNIVVDAFLQSPRSNW